MFLCRYSFMFHTEQHPFDYFVVVPFASLRWVVRLFESLFRELVSELSVVSYVFGSYSFYSYRMHYVRTYCVLGRHLTYVMIQEDYTKSPWAASIATKCQEHSKVNKVWCLLFEIYLAECEISVAKYMSDAAGFFCGVGGLFWTRDALTHFYIVNNGIFKF